MKEFNPKNKKKILLTTVCLLLIFAVGIAAMHRWEEKNGTFSGDGEELQEVISFDGTDYIFNDDVKTFMFLGLDKTDDTVSQDSYNNNMQADFVMLLAFDTKNHTYSALQLNRDTMVEMPVLGVTGDVIGTKEGQLALGHTYGSGGKDSCINMRKTVSDFLLGVPIDGYVSLRMDAVPVINDSLGGVTVNVTDDFSGLDNTIVMGENFRLNGKQALTYIRARQGMKDNSNEQRMKRQQEYLSGLKSELEAHRNDDEFIGKLLLDINEYMVSDCSVNRLEDTFKKITDYEFGGIKTLEGDTEIGEFKEFYADGESVLSTVTGLFCEPK